MSRGKLFQRGCPAPPSSPGACLAGFSVSISPQQGRGRRAGGRGQTNLGPGSHCHFAVGMENRQMDLCTLRVPRDSSQQAGGEVGRRGIGSVRVCPYTLPGSEPQSKRLDTPSPGPLSSPFTYSPSSCHRIPSWPCLPTYLLGPGPKSAAETKDPTLSPFSQKILAVILAQHSTCCVALGKSLRLPEPQLPLESNARWAGAPKSFHFRLAASIPVSSSAGIKCLTVLGKPNGLITRGMGCTSP